MWMRSISCLNNKSHNQIRIDMAQRSGMFSAFADDDDEPQQKTVQQKKPVAQVQPKVQEKPKTAKPFKQEDLADFDGVTGPE